MVKLIQKILFAIVLMVAISPSLYADVFDVTSCVKNNSVDGKGLRFWVAASNSYGIPKESTMGWSGDILKGETKCATARGLDTDDEDNMFVNTAIIDNNTGGPVKDFIQDEWYTRSYRLDYVY